MKCFADLEVLLQKIKNELSYIIKRSSSILYFISSGVKYPNIFIYVTKGQPRPHCCKCRHVNTLVVCRFFWSTYADVHWGEHQIYLQYSVTLWDWHVRLLQVILFDIFPGATLQHSPCLHSMFIVGISLIPRHVLRCMIMRSTDYYITLRECQLLSWLCLIQTTTIDY